jgi:hypothetical protein
MTVAGGDAAPQRGRVAVHDLLTVPEFQIRKKVNPGTVRHYAGLLRAGTILPPVLAGMIDGALVLLDGFHRVEAHRQAGIPDIEVEVVPTSVPCPRA